MHIQHKTQGKNFGLGVTTYLLTIFEANELLHKSRKLTDDQIALRLSREFPDRPSVQDFISAKPSKTINSYRYRYNQGKFTHNIPPKFFSFRYNKKGQRVNFKTGTYLLTPEEMEAILSDHKLNREAALRSLL